MAGFDVYIDEAGKVFEVTIVKADGVTPRNLSGGTIKLQIERNDEKEMTIVNAAGGIAEYEVQAGDFPTPGVFVGSVLVEGIEGGGVTTRTEPFEFAVHGVPEVAP